MWSKDDVIRETRWSRDYQKPGSGNLYMESRFMDGSATITLAELKRDWQRWPSTEQLDFAQSFDFAETHEREDILRFLIQNGDHHIWAAIALLVATKLPTDESIPAIRRWCESCTIGRGANYYQAIAHTNAPEARTILKCAYDRISHSEGRMDSDDFWNWVAYDMICCVQYLLELNENPNTYRAVYDELKDHPSELTRHHVERCLTKYFATEKET